MIIALCIETALSLEFVDIFYTDFWQFSMNFPICFLLFLLFFCNSMSCSGCSVLYGANAVLYLRLNPNMHVCHHKSLLFEIYHAR